MRILRKIAEHARGLVGPETPAIAGLGLVGAGLWAEFGWPWAAIVIGTFLVGAAIWGYFHAAA